jgi:hypothetical protein
MCCNGIFNAQFKEQNQKRKDSEKGAGECA